MLDPGEIRRLKVLEGVGLESIEGQLGRGEVRALAQGDVLLTMGEPARNEMDLMRLARRLRTNNSTASDNIRLQREHKRNALSTSVAAVSLAVSVAPPMLAALEAFAALQGCVPIALRAVSRTSPFWTGGAPSDTTSE